MRKFLGLGLCLSVLLGFSTSAFADSSPLDKAYVFLDGMMDRYAQDDTLRLVQSYVPTATFDNGDISYTYDDTVMIVALLQRGHPDDIARARVIGDSLLYAQQHDPLADGRVRDAYHANPFINADQSVNIASKSSFTGNLAWAGMALLQLHRATGDATYLSTAATFAAFIEANAFDTRGAGGFTGGFKASGDKLLWKSTEHNIDLYAFYSMLAQASHDRKWKADAKHAMKFVKAMWSREGGYYFIGTGDDGKKINRNDPTPEDVQTWSFLSLGKKSHSNSINWALANLSATGGDFQGLSFEVRDRSGVWFEGTAHTAAALEARGGTDDLNEASVLLSDIEIGQANAPNTDGNGIDAASKDGLLTGDSGDAYYASLHIGATGWYCIAKQAGNPFVLAKH
jgi:hypothetical protein